MRNSLTIKLGDKKVTVPLTKDLKTAETQIQELMEAHFNAMVLLGYDADELSEIMNNLADKEE